jgi:hypothetical protein
VSPRPDWQLRPHGTPAAIRRHIRRKTPLCDSCRQGSKRISAEKWAATATYVVHADSGDGTARCAAHGAREVAAPGQDVTCKRCKAIRGES